MYPESCIEKFWGLVHKTDTCWLWTGRIRPNGYGVLDVAGAQVRAHRFAWQLVHGPIPTGAVICHRCDVRACVRIEHLFLGTQHENLRDAAAKNRMPGHKKLTAEDVTQVLSMLQAGMSQADTGAVFGVNQSTISDIKTRTAKAWRLQEHLLRS